jgi:hypothetical protein
MINFMTFLGFGEERDAISFFVRFARDPFHYLSDARDEKKVLVSILVFVWRVMLALRLFDVFFIKPTSELWIKITAVLLFIFMKQIAQLALWFNGHVINLFVRFIAQKNNVIAAQRAFTFSAIVPNPLVYIYTVAPLLRGILNPIVSTFVIYGICFTGGAAIWSFALGKQYRLSNKSLLFISILPALLSSFFVFQIPFFLSVKFSPSVVKKDIDLSILNMTSLPVDSSVDGAFYLKESFLQISDDDTKLIDSLSKSFQSIDNRLASVLAENYKRMTPLFACTYFDKRNLYGILPEFPISVDSSMIDPKYCLVLGGYFKNLLVYSQHLYEIRNYSQALGVFSNALRLTKRVGDSNLGLCCAVTTTVYSKRICKVIDNALMEIRDITLLNQFAAAISENQVNPEWTLNALRLEYYRGNAVESQTSIKILKEYRAQQDSVGFFVPDYSFKKFYDPEDTHEIHSYIWARIIKQSSYPTVNELSAIPEIDRITNGRFHMLRLAIFKNTIGRILVCVAVPLYRTYAFDAFNALRYMEFVYIAIRLRISQLSKHSLNHAFSELIAKSDPLKFKKTMRLYGDTLLSIDSMSFKDTYRISF